ncbi:MAG: FAD-binding oxidoreductase, partial [Steroidobacteraceae bacterium]|nr:FAD-binding oxidoreductase [Steroidobacteraceae bacterium]
IRAAYAVVGTGEVPDVLAITGDGREITLRGADVRDLAKKMRGRLLLAGEDGYDKARLVLNPSFDKHPALIAQPTGAADVQSVVSFARANNLLVAVKCGGHSHSGQSSCDRGLQIDLSSFRGVRVDPAARRVSVAGGTLLGQVDHECMAHGLVAPLGTVSHTGVGGLTLGGGFGRLARRFGMAIDNLESVDIVTADGKLRHASAKENKDLFWAVRGGSGNFGVVTNFEFRLHPMEREVIAGEISFPIERAKEVLGAWAEYAATAPDTLYLDPAIVLPPGGRPGYVGIEVCYSGPKQDADRLLAPFRKLGTPTRDTIAAKDYVEVQRANDMGDSRSMGTYLKGGFISKVPKPLVSAIVDGIEGDPNRMTLLFFQHCGGAASRVAEGETAFAQRDSLANMMVVTGWNLGTVEPAPHIDAARRYWKKVEPFTRGFYVNDLAREVTSKDINENYRGNYPRLLKIKKTYDPTNLFRLNANINV